MFDRDATSACSGCGDPILWAGTSHGRGVPLDAAPSPLGHLVLDEHGRTGPADGEPGTPDMTVRYTRHQCPVPEPAKARARRPIAPPAPPVVKPTQPSLFGA